MPENTDAYAKQLAEELAAAKQQAADAIAAKEAAEKATAEAEAALKASGGPVPIKGAYKGYTFPAGHARIRNQEGALCDTQAVLDAANAGDETACAILDHLIKIKYGYLVAVKK